MNHVSTYDSWSVDIKAALCVIFCKNYKGINVSTISEYIQPSKARCWDVDETARWQKIITNRKSKLLP